MPPRLIFPERAAAADVLTFAGRAARLGDGAVRLRATDGTLVVTSAPLAPRGLFDTTPTVLAMRVSPVDPELQCDLVVEASSLRADEGDASALLLPDTALAPSWAGVSPPRGGWESREPVAAATLAARAQWGIQAVAEAMPADPGEDIVRTVRASVWGAPDDALGGLPLGAAFAAFAMGFIAGEEEAQSRVAAAWSRLTLSRGHILVRGPARSGLTAVRRTGDARD
ncbi:hypothetical protein RYJ27_05160 [Microbacterium limosum]|uniref:Urease accessory protein n=1 Tax=Microbacterium limosum TaxID=3079935 RepID=A0AAU0MIZ2_9MICO|nr:hypothetical protein [Microbacterium sp. Y20]WOQ70594.1 hypothetical protein RYJ27_05160 [Microbacterium sp. Y20]